MFRRVAMIGALSVFLTVMRGDVTQAHYVTLGGSAFYHSLGCTELLTQLPGGWHEGRLQCTFDVALVESLCKNPAGQEVTGEAATQVKVVGEGAIDQGGFKKDKGKVTASTVIVEVDNEFDSSVCVNPNWQLVRVHVKLVTVTMDAFACTGPKDDPCSTTELASTLVLSCESPAQYNVLNPPPQFTPLACTTVSIQHHS